MYTRVEGTPNDPNPDKPFSKIEVKGLFNSEGKLNPSITVIGTCAVTTAGVPQVFNCTG
jgi:mannose-1-phosphate guanylyltransferase